MMLEHKLLTQLNTGFADAFGGVPTDYFSAPGRTEIGGNHTDHQRGHVLAAAVDVDTRAAVAINGTDTIRVLSEGYPLCSVSLSQLEVCPEEKNTTAALVRGVAARFVQLGCAVGGFDAYVTSSVLPGSGLSSSAAFEVLMATIINALFFDSKLAPPQLAQIAQYAENVYFGKPCGLMDQMASAVGGLVAIDFADPDRPQITEVDFDFDAAGYKLCIIDTGADHADLTDAYAAIPGELKAVSAYFGKQVLSQVPREDFENAISQLRQSCGDRAVLRAMHFYEEDVRVALQVRALGDGDVERFMQLVTESGNSSYMQLQNVIVPGSVVHQEVALALSLCRRFLNGRGAYRVHGGGFAGTVQAFVPEDMLTEFCRQIRNVLGENACKVMSVRKNGATRLKM